MLFDGSICEGATLRDLDNKAIADFIETALEAIVNAVAHRDYRSSGFVQVIVFADRMEVWNPGELPLGLTPELLREPHGPMPRNPLTATIAHSEL